MSASDNPAGGFHDIDRDDVVPASRPDKPYKPFPTDELPGPVARFIREAAKSLGCDEAFVALPLLAALAGLIGNSRRIRLRKDWDEPCVLWTGTVADSGTLKTPAHDKALQVPRKIEGEYQLQYEEAFKAYSTEVTKHDALVRRWRLKAPESDPPEPPDEPVATRLLVSDATTEAVVKLLRTNPRGLTLECEELSGWFDSFDAYRHGRGADAAHWLKMHGARPLTVDRKTERSAYIPRAAVSITGGIQPGVLRRVLGRQHFEDGMAARFLFAMPPKQRRQWTESEISDESWRVMDQIARSLLGLEMEHDDGRSRPIDLPLTPEAKQTFIEFFEGWSVLRESLTGDIDAAYSKLEGGAARLALVIQLCGWAGGEPGAAAPAQVDAASMAAGISLARWFAYETERIYDLLGATDEEREQRELVTLIEKRGGRLRCRDLMRARRKYGTAERAEQALDDLVRAGYGIWQSVPKGGRGGRPTREFVLRPAPPVDTTGEVSWEDRVVSTSTPPKGDSRQVLDRQATVSSGGSETEPDNHAPTLLDGHLSTDGGELES